MNRRWAFLIVLEFVAFVTGACSSSPASDATPELDVARLSETLDSLGDSRPLPDAPELNGSDLVESLTAADLVDVRDVESDRRPDATADPGVEALADVHAETDGEPVACDPAEGPFGPYEPCFGLCGPLAFCESCACDADLGVCVKKVEFGPSCCVTDQDCDDGNPATPDLCPTPGAPCVLCPSIALCVGAPQVAFSADFETGGLSPFLVDADNNPADAVTWQLDASTQHEGAWSAYFGDPLCHTYYNGALTSACQPVDPSQSDATVVSVRLLSESFQMGAADSPCVYFLTFWARFEGEPSWTGYEDATSDQLRIFVQAGDERTQVFASAVATPTNSTEGVWRFFFADLTAFWAKTVRLQFEFDSVDGANNLYYGAAIDDIVVRSVSDWCWSGCPSDGDPCTDDSCTLFPGAGPCDPPGVCAYLPSASACP